MPMRMRRFLSLSFLLFAIFAQNVSAIPDDGTSLYPDPQDPPPVMTFYDVLSDPCDPTAIAEVECNVFQYDPCEQDPYDYEYVYTYQITNIFDADLTWFSVTFDAVNVYEPSWDSDPCWVDPDYWDIAGSPTQSVEGIFTSTIGLGESSALLWFASDNVPIWGEGALAGLSSGFVFATGDLIVPAPIPEPASLLLFGAGGLVAVIRKRRSA